jgi:hypothetical protein
LGDKKTPVRDEQGQVIADSRAPHNVGQGRRSTRSLTTDSKLLLLPAFCCKQQHNDERTAMVLALRTRLQVFRRQDTTGVFAQGH